MPDKLCLYYHIGQCMGPCVYDVDLDKYAQMTKEISDFLHGEDKTILNHLQERMEKRVSLSISNVQKSTVI